jgi:diphosphomevalonate decarboxylase
MVLHIFPELDVIMPFPDSKTKQVVLVNEKDVDVGTCEKQAAHIQGKLHRAFSVFVLREYQGRAEILLQQRSSNKYHSADLWSNTCCGHPRAGENIVDAGEKRLREEMGFGVELKEIGQFHYTAKLPESGLIENELDHVLIGFSDLNEFQMNPDEAQDCAWIDVLELHADLQQNPQRYTAWLSQALDLLLQYL